MQQTTSQFGGREDPKRLLFSAWWMEHHQRRQSIAFVLSCLGSVQLFQVTCICFESLTFRAQRPERRGEVLWQLCLQQEEECAGVGDPSGLHIIWNPEICGEL